MKSAGQCFGVTLAERRQDGSPVGARVDKAFQRSVFLAVDINRLAADFRQK